MRILILLAILTIVSGCGLQNQINHLRKKSNEAETRVAILQNRVLDIEGNIQNSLALVTGRINSLALTIANTPTLTTVEADAITAQITALQLNANDLITQLAVVQGVTGIVGIRTPCGASPGLNEVILRLNDGRYLSSYSDNPNGTNTRFIILLDGTYRTTDGRRCVYTVSNYGTVISNERFY